MDFERISVLISTRGRVERLRTLLASYEATGSVADSQLVFRVDEDDRETWDFLMRTNHRVIVGPRLGGYRAMPTFFNQAAAASVGDVLMCGNDDMVFETVGWAELILVVANRYPDGFFDVGVSTHNEAHYPFSIVSRIVVEALGFIWDPTIFWGDIYLRDVMAHFGRCVMAPEVRIAHDWAGFRPDRTFMESDKDITGRDPTYWQGTHARAVTRAIERLEPLWSASACRC